MNWRQDDLWQIFWAPRWLEGLTLPPGLTLDESRGGVQRRTYYDPGQNRIVASVSQRDVAILPPRLFTPAEYAEQMMRVGFNDTWRQETERTLKNVASGTNRKNGGLVNIDLPFQLPRGLSSVFGEGAPNLRVSGSEQISMGGTSTWQIPEPQHEGRRPSRFPSLEMRQVLNVRLNGTIGDKLHIDIAQNSEASTSLENQIKIYYQGYDDDVIQRVDLGNTNLSLPHTQYISYSARQEGLFGVKMLGRFADWDFTAIASKQEGQGEVASFSGGSRETVIGGDDGRIYDYEFLKRKYFLLFDPDTSTTFPPGLRILANDLDVFVNRNDNYGETRNGEEITNARVTLSGQPDSIYFREQFVRLKVNDDYYFVTSEWTPYPLLVMRSQLSPDWTLAVSYRVRDAAGNIVATVGNYPAAANDTTYLKMIYAPNREKGNNLRVGTWAATRRLELKNVYDIGVRNIDPATFNLSIRREGGTNPSFQDSISYLEILGLDIVNNESQLAREETDKSGARGPDGKIDPRYIDYENGLIFFPDLRPFDPSPIDLNGALQTPEDDGFRAPSRREPRARALGYNRTSVPKSEVNRFGVLYVRMDSLEARNEVNGNIYDERDPQTESRKYFITGTFRAFQTDINLNRIGILENSETVRMDGEVLSRGQDYTISYDTGQVRLISDRATNPNGNLQITYSYTPLFARGDRSLVGFSTAYGGSPNWDLSSTVLYESKGSPDRRPRLQQEPSRTILGDLSGSWRARPWLLTELTDALPLIHTTAPSNISVSGALGVSVPNPNTKGDVYLDDMEGVVQTTSAGIARENWQYAGRPATQALTPIPGEPLRDEDRMGAVWYSLQRQVLASDLNPRLSTTERNDFISALGILMIPNPAALKPWLGLVQQFSENGVDLREAQYIELWINDLNRFHDRDNPSIGEGKELRIDLGKMSEDAVWDPRTPPVPANGRLDKEDTNADGQRTPEEDVGLDSIPDFTEKAIGVLPDSGEFAVSTPGDPAGDDYIVPPNSDDYSGSIADRIRRFRHINGTENDLRLEGEDYNKNGSLDTDEDYFEYTIPLNSTEFTVVDVNRDYGKNNGWRLLRIPLNHPSRQQVGTPDMNSIRQVRIWFNGFADTTEIQIASLDVVGNQWEKQAIRGADGLPIPADVVFRNGKVFNVAVVNNKENPDYVSPFGVQEINNVPEREQSLSLQFENLDPGEQVSAFRPLTRDEDYTLYQTLSYYVQPHRDPELQAPLDSLEFFLRLSSSANNDSANVYEISTHQLTQDTWRSIDLALSDLSSLKIGASDSALANPSGLTAEKQFEDVLVRVYGRPSFNQIRRLQVGVRNIGTFRIPKGQLWFNELRLGNVRRDLGIASRGSAAIALGDFASVSAAFSQTNADFLTLGQSRGRGITNRDLSIGTSVNVDRMLPSIGILAPLRFDIRKNRNTPKFRANNDIIFNGKAGGADITESGSTAASLALRRVSDQNTPWYVRSTIDALAMTMNYSRNYNNQTSQVDSGMVVTGSVSYGLRLADPPGLPLPGRTKFTPLPNQFSLSYTAGYTEQSSYGRDPFDVTRLKQLTRKANRSGGLQMQTSFRPLSPVTYNITSQRDLIGQNFSLNGDIRPTLKIAGIDLGREVTRSERVTFSQSFNLTSFFRPRVTWNGDYTEDHRPQIVTPSDIDDQTVTPDLKNLENKSSTTVNLTLPVSRLFNFLSGGSGPHRMPTSNRRPGPRAVVNPEEPPNRTPAQTTPAPIDTLGRAPSLSDSTGAQVSPGQAGGPTTAGPGPVVLVPGIPQVPADTSGTVLPNRTAPPVTTPLPDTRQGGAAARGDNSRPGQATTPSDSALTSGGKREKEGNQGGGNLFKFLFRDLVSLGDIKGSFTTSNRNAVTRVFGTPPPEFRLGLSQNFGEVERALNSTESHSTSNSATANAAVQVLRDFSVDANYQWNDSETNNNQAVTHTTTTTWPSLRMNLGALERKFKLGWLFSSFTATSNFERREEVAGSALNRRERVTVSNSWRPFFQFDAQLKNGWRTQFQTDRTSSRIESNSAGLSNTGVATERTSRMYRLALGKALGRRGTTAGRNAVDMNLEVKYSKDASVTEYAGQTQGTSNGNDNFQGILSTNYRFTSTVSGTMQLSVGQNRDLVTDISRRSIGLQATAGISF